MYFIRDRINQVLMVKKKIFVYRKKNTKVVCKEY